MNRRDALTHAFLTDLNLTEDAYPNSLQAITEVAQDVLTIEKNDPEWAAARVLRRLAEPDRIISFRVTWMDDAGAVRVNRGWRVQGSNAIGPYKGGLRFHPSVNEDVLRFLAFEQCFKNALTGLPLGGAKGGADLDPSGLSNTEIMRFCQAFMAQLWPHIGPDKDVPAGDINVGPREIGYLFGAWRDRSGLYQGTLTGKGTSYGGSEMRVEATGYGLIYFLECALAARDDSLQGKRIAISGKGNVATHAALKAIKQGAAVIALSDTSGTLFAEDGMSETLVAWVRERKDLGEDLASPPKGEGATFKDGKTPWAFEPEIALPCATQNELDEDMAKMLRDAQTQIVGEGANMPLTDGAAQVLRDAGIVHLPGKAGNAGGVAVSGLEMSQMSHRRFASAEEVDAALKGIMQDIHARVAEDGGTGQIDYVRGANIAGYRRLAQAISAQGVI